MKSFEYYNKIANLYDEMYNNKKWKTLRKAVSYYIDRTLPFTGGTVLDIGTGTGYWLKFFLDRKFRVYALEPSSKMLEVARRKYGNNVVYFNTTIEDFEFNKKFDVLNVQGDVLSYVEDLDFVMKKIKELLKHNGLLFATVDSYYFMEKLVRKYGTINEIKKFQKTHITTVGSQYGIFNSRCFTVDDIYELEKYEFKVIEIRGCGYSEDFEEEIRKSKDIIQGEHIYFSLKNIG